jgi:glycosyltransferase involved in cell wall biosynthesis
MDVRACSFAERLQGSLEIHITHRHNNKVAAIFRFLSFLLRVRPALCYVLDMGFSGVLAAGLYCLVMPCRMVVDTGDDIYEIGRNSGRGRLALWLTRLLERFALFVSDCIVVRSHPHAELLEKKRVPVELIPDGVDTKQFTPLREDDLRRHHNLAEFTVVGILGSLIWNPLSKTCYGSELIEIIDRLRDQPVKGVIIGDGSGLSVLKAHCAARGLEDRILFLGRIPYDELPQYLNLMDICLSTQTNDAVGQVRTTGKLPLYLACGRFVLASEVGEAARVLPPEMLVPYHGSMDDEYPGRLAARIQHLITCPEQLDQREQGTAIARAHFDYDILAARLQRCVDRTLELSNDHRATATGFGLARPTGQKTEKGSER